MILWYRNSVLASLLSCLGCVCLVVAVSTGTDEAALLVIPAILMIILGKIISDDKAFKTWWNQIEDKNLEPQIAQNAALAVAVYQKNPCRRTLNKLKALNPAAEEEIKKYKAAKKAAGKKK